MIGKAELIAERNVVGVTTNPSIFEKALTSGVAEYQKQLIEQRHAAREPVDGKEQRRVNAHR